MKLRGIKMGSLLEKAAAPVCLAAALGLATLAWGGNETHLDRSKLPMGCVSCHKGHGARASLMLNVSKDQVCLQCHGPVKRGRKGESQTDISSLLTKRSNHPILQTSNNHLQGEILPERSSSAPRHVSCEDCHDPHLTTKDIPFKVARGYDGRMKVVDVRREYEVCFLCHSDSANLPPDAHNIAQDFASSSASYHPVEFPGRNSSVPSLVTPLTTSSTIGCSDCHGNDDKFGPKGPHGSNYDHILRANYNTDSGPESPAAYDLCYWCHSRSSILNNDSFKAHKRHVVYENLSCYACHASHGSRTYGSLISFDGRLAFPNALGQLNYIALLPGKPRCFLNCHVGALQVEHVMKGSQYYVANNPVQGW